MNDSDKSEMLPCAHCGSNRVFDGTKGMGPAHKRVSCLNCGSQSSSLETWNTRSPSSREKALVSAMENVQTELKAMLARDGVLDSKGHINNLTAQEIGRYINNISAALTAYRKEMEK